MKKLFFAVFALSILFTAVSCKSDNQVFVRFQNSTDSAIEESTMDFGASNQTDVGPIAAGETSDYIAFDYFEVGYYPGGEEVFPMGELLGKKDGVAFTAWSWNWCGTGVEYKQLEPGNYTILISSNGSDSLTYQQIKFLD